MKKKLILLFITIIMLFALGTNAFSSVNNTSIKTFANIDEVIIYAKYKYTPVIKAGKADNPKMKKVK